MRSSHRAIVSEAARHLSAVSVNLSSAYSSQTDSGFSLTAVSGLFKHPDLPPPPPPMAEDKGPVIPPTPPRDPFSLLTAKVLRNEEGIEGGFLAAKGPLVGYAFPTHEGPGERKEMPQRERPTIDDLAHKAESSNSSQNLTFEGPHDVIIFTASPVRESVDGRQQITGAVWLMQRIPGINRGRSKQLLFVSLGFGVAALATALLAWFVTVEVSGGVSAITHRLASLEKDLSQSAGVRDRPQLDEFERVLTGINAMAVSLRNRIANERSLENRLRHKERLSSLGQFAAGVAHELRNPLATIRLRAEMSQHSSTEPAIGRNSGIILEEVDRLNSMISRLLYFARPISLNLQPLDVGELCTSIVHSWNDRTPETIRLEYCMSEVVHVLADQNCLRQVLDNLIENAIQASSKDGGEVMIQTAQQLDTVQIDVIDAGSGFTPEALEHAFDPFYTTKDTGTGLGLSIAFELVEAHGGHLHAASRHTGGAIVSVVLPRKLHFQGNAYE